MKVEDVKPYGTGENKRTQIQHAFDVLAHRYDLLNHVLSLSIDRTWRRRALKHLDTRPPAQLLDAATGTADFAILAARRFPETQVTGIDLSENMLAIGRVKAAAAGLDRRVALTTGDCLALAFADASFDAVTIAFGVRNFENLTAGLRELRRVIRPGGQLVILELSEPQSCLLRPFARFYLRTLVPLVGRILTGHTREYRYLPASIAQVPTGEAMLGLMRRAGFETCRCERYTFGLCSCYTAVR